MLKFTDYVKINPDSKLLSLDKKEKIKLIDSCGCDSNEPGKSGLLVTYDLSHSGRRINNRVYSPVGQMEGVESLMKPYPKPILLNHDQDQDPIGRFVDGQWQDLTNYNLSHFENVADVADLQKAFGTYDYEKVYSLMKKNRLLTNPNYSGLGRIRVQASITDPKAIEKFLDGRYMTFSAGSTTDKHVCSICMSDWAQGDICEHRHGRIYDNEICVFMTGSFKILEGSVVNTPADDLSQIISMEYYDSNNELQDLNVDAKMDPSSFYLSDSFFNLIKDSEVQMEQEKESTVEEVNVVEETVAEETATDSAETTVEEEVVAEVAVDSETETETSEVEKQMSDAEESIVENIDADVDWYLLDCALSVELEDKTLSAEERKQLPESAFCGPNRSFPVNDCVHVTAARRLIGRAKLSDAAKAKVLACVNKKAEAMRCDIEKDSSEVLTEEVKTLKAELADVKAELEKSLVEIKALVESFQADNTEEIKQADSLAEEVIEVVTEDLKVIENPSAGSSDSSSPTEESLLDSLGAFEKKAVKQYSEILNKDGEAAANTFWEFKSQYLNKGFDPKKYIK